jgi:threonylcarbamoyladenosine tRNA methylthiotransferase MtaB
MKRRHSAAQALDLCARLKAERPQIALGADFIAGFPTETEDHFDALLQFAQECGLAYLHVFPFSARDGTPAAKMPQLPRDVVKARAARLRALGGLLLRTHLDTHVGKVRRAMVEKPGLARLSDFTQVRISGGVAGEWREALIARHDGETLFEDA